MKTVDGELYQVDMNDIHIDEEFNCRGKIAPIDVVDLAKDIEKRGLISPVIITPYSEEKQQVTGKKFLLVAGYRRYGAHVVLKKEYIKAIVRYDLDNEKEARLFNLSENLIRKNLNILQEAKAISKLRDLGLTEHSTAEALSQSRGWVQIRFMILKLPDDIQKDIGAGFLSQSDIRNIYSIYNTGNITAMYETVGKIKDNKIKGYSPQSININRKKLTSKALRRKPEIFLMQDHIREAIGNNLGTKCLAWAAGELSNIELYEAIKEEAEVLDVEYKIPEEE